MKEHKGSCITFVDNHKLLVEDEIDDIFAIMSNPSYSLTASVEVEVEDG